MTVPLVLTLACMVGVQELRRSETAITWREHLETGRDCTPDWNAPFESATCPFVRVRYPEIRQLGGKAQSERVNRWVSEVIGQALGVEPEQASVAEAGRRYLAKYAAFERAHPYGPV